MTMYYTDTSGGSLGTSLVQTAYDTLVNFPLRTTPCFRQFATKSPQRPAMKGASIVIQDYANLPVQTTALTETVDPDTVAIPNTTSVTVTPAEYGAATLITKKLELTDLAGSVDVPTANIIAYNMIDSIDTLIQTTIRGGTQVIRENGGSLVVGGATASVASTDTIQSRDIRVAVAKLRTNAVLPWSGNDFMGVIHPDISMDLRAEASTIAGWRSPNVYGSDQNRIWAGEIGHYEGVRWIENPRAYTAKDGVGGTVRVYRSYVFARDAIVEAVFEEPHVVIGPQVDRLKRFYPIGWYGVLGWAFYRQAAMFRLENAASVPIP